MKSFIWVFLLFALSARLTWSAVPLSSIKRVSNLPTVSNRFIVEVNAPSNIPNEHSSPYELLYASLRERDIGFEIDKEFNSQGLFIGVALTLMNAQDVVDLQNTRGIKAIRAVRKFERPAPIKFHAITGLSNSNATNPLDLLSTHVLTGVDKLHAEGVTGKGIKIGILDTGIDYTHPALGGGFGPGHKVIGGFDLVGDAYDGTNTPVPDPDPLDQCAGHGTHVAGIIGADPVNEFNISGVAYDSFLSSYRVFGCNGFVTDDVLVDALLLGVKDGQDILTLSIGGADGWTESSASVVASRIAASGKIVTIAAGNDGTVGSWYTSGPGNGINVISVASLDNTVIPLQNATVGGVAHPPITYFQTFPFNITDALPIFATSNDTTIIDDACNSLPLSTPDLSPYLVIVRRGTCTFVQKLTNIAAKGGKTALIYDNGTGFTAISVDDFHASLIQAADGEFLVSQFVAGVPVTITFPQSGASTQYPDPAGGLISSFTSYGPSNDFFFKPSIAAPGGNILSTLPTTKGSYGVASGTSMATPFVAGGAALLLSVKGTSSTVSINARTLFETTARSILSNHTDSDPLQTLTQQGAGLINVFDAVHTTTIVSPSQLILNDTAHFMNQQVFTIENIGNTTKKYTLNHVPAGTAITVKPGTIFPATGPVPLSSAAASVSLSQTAFALPPGKRQTISARFDLPSHDASTFPVFSGFIQISSNDENLHVTYLGLAASLEDKQVIDNTNVFFGVPLPAILNSTGDVQVIPTNYSFSGEDFPTLLFRLVFGTPALRVDLVDPNIQIKETLVPRQERHGSPFFTFPQTHEGGSFAQVKIVGALAELDFVSRNNEDPDVGFNTIAFPQATFANGTRIPNGSYKVLIRALKVTGDPKKEEDYESWLSPVLGVAV